ncbi:hypothetical protein GCM10023189_50770 [Nibrella saemangeumensis]|uniref:NlpC/P60 domain-containing protein n=1 Tax=Nibrella saemangeumensis TaxID=1084526 RepID=A0ABP8NKB0_9BACT
MTVPFVAKCHRRVTLLAILLSFTLTSCEIFRPATTTSAPARRPATVARSKYKTVDTQTYQRQYASEVIRLARTYTGTPYRSGGNTKDGIDCSGLLCSVFNSIGLEMPRISWQQSEVGYEVEVNQIRPGDLLFFVPEHSKSGYVSHAGIVTEIKGRQDIRFIHASSSRGVREDNLFTNYFKGRFVKAVRPF